MNSFLLKNNFLHAGKQGNNSLVSVRINRQNNACTFFKNAARSSPVNGCCFRRDGKTVSSFLCTGLIKYWI
jgi:hypothetical protein